MLLQSLNLLPLPFAQPHHSALFTYPFVPITTATSSASSSSSLSLLRFTRSVAASTRPKALPQWLAQIADVDGPIELPYSPDSLFATTDDPSPIQVATSVLLTGAIGVFLFRSLRRRAKKVKEMQFRSTGVKKSLKEEALESLKALTPATVDTSAPPSPLQTLFGGITAGIIALILYKFTTTIEAALNRQTISNSFSVQQITITVRTIINGVCYLATFVFGLNAVGLVLYSGQLALNSLTEGSSNEGEPVDDEKLNSGNDGAGSDDSL